MNLKEVHIINFRSIKDCTISLAPRCRVLVGINEAGKSNILKALSLLSPSENPTKDDIRQPLRDEQPPKMAWVDFIFALDATEAEQIANESLKKVYTEDPEKAVLRQHGEAENPKQFFISRNRGLYRVNVFVPAKFPSYWTLGKEYSLEPGWKKPSASCPPSAVLPGTALAIKNFSLIYLKDYKDVPAGYLDEATIETANEIAGEQLKSLVLAKLPEVVYWTYQEKNLLPSQIGLDQFQASPTTCVPLMHMFGMADVPNIAPALTEARQKPQLLRNLLNRVAGRATKHLHEVWRETRAIEIDLSPNGPHIDASIKDKDNLFDFAHRSDGFKRFITFLLMISARVRTRNLQNAFVLIDEPEIGLHPTGARFLMEELIKISAANAVVYSTHSIFMIDRQQTDRHLIVTKANETTSAVQADASNIADEEVLYKALGYSIFDSLQKSNFIFEGWRDKELFKIATSKPPKGASFKTLGEIGLCHAEGVGDIRKVTQMMELARRKCFILSDADSPAQKAKQDFIDSNGYGQWFTYRDILGDDSALTGEDFLKPSAFHSAIGEIRNQYPILAPLSDAELVLPHGKIKALRKWLLPIGPDSASAALRLIKTQVFAELTPGKIEPHYFVFLEKLSAQITSQHSGKTTTGLAEVIF